MNRKAVVFWAVVTAAMFVGVGVAADRGRQRPEPATTAARRRLAVTRADVVTVGKTTVPRLLEATGTVRPELEAAVATKVTGRVLSIAVREGDWVRQGQTLVRLDARDLDAAIDQASANVRAARVGEGNARVAATMEASLGDARIAQAEARFTQAQAALAAAVAQRDLVRSGPRRQERAQAAQAVEQARTVVDLARVNRDRMAKLYEAGAIPRQQLDTYESQYEVAEAQYRIAQEAQSIAEEGSRAEELRAAEQAVLQARAEVGQARAGLKQARAAALQAAVRRQEIEAARAQTAQGLAALRSARVTRDYATMTAPFDGVVSARLVDPGAMAAPGVPLLKVQGGAIRLEAVVPESALAYARRGATLPVHLDALRGQDLSGRIVETAPQGDPASHTFVVKIDLPSAAGATPGMFGRAWLVVGWEERLLVPAAAVQERDGLDYVYVVDATDTARVRLVTVGAPDGGRVPVLSGLREGERIVAGGRERITEGVRVATQEGDGDAR